MQPLLEGKQDDLAQDDFQLTTKETSEDKTKPPYDLTVIAETEYLN